MTICIGAICENGQAAVVAADRMMTFGPPISLQTEPPVKKILSLTDSVVLLFSGSVPDGEEVGSQVRVKVAGAPKLMVAQIADFAKSAYVELKKKRVEDTILRPLLGVDYPGYLQCITQSSSSQILTQILGLMNQHNLQLDLFLAGLDTTGAHLYGVTHPGVLYPLETMGFAAIGSGGVHAGVRLNLEKQTKSTPFADTVYNVFAAKKSSEVAPGVGKFTDMAVLREGKISFFEEATIQALENVHGDKPTLAKAQVEALKRAVEQYEPKAK